MTTNIANLEKQTLAALARVDDPYLGIDLAKAKVLKTLAVEGEKLCVHLRFAYPFSEYPEAVLKNIQIEIEKVLPQYTLALRLDWKINRHLAPNKVKAIPNIKNVIAIGSGKGGVGKSTTAINLALALQSDGAKVGLLDADIYGPNQPLLLGVKEKPDIRVDNHFQPVIQYGLQTMSMGYLVEDNAAVVWRGPMISRAFEQLLHETTWEDLDYLIIDLPPGTGDIQLTLAQKMPACGAVLVTTPQEVALMDVRKALAMFKKVTVPVLGIVENMGAHTCSQCGHQEAIFGEKGAEKLAAEQEVPLLGILPLDRQLREHSDWGKPVVVSEPTGSLARLYRKMARCLSAGLSLQARDYTVAKPLVVST